MRKVLLISVFSLALAACGGGGGSSGSNTPPGGGGATQGISPPGSVSVVPSAN